MSTIHVSEPKLSAEQERAVSSALSSGLVQAGAGTGKTFVMAKRVAWLATEHGLSADAILGLTFTNKAASELAQRVEGKALVQTYNAFAQNLVTEFGVLIGIESGVQVLAEVARFQLAARTALRTNLPLEQLRLSKRQVINGLVALDDALSNHGVSTAALRKHDRELVEKVENQPKLTLLIQQMLEAAKARLALSELVDEFREAKKSEDVMDFADQIRLAQEIVSVHPMVSEILRQRHQVVLLDEYQDTSVSQRRLLTECFGQRHPVTAVGDPLQSIYEWRAASVANLLEFPNHFIGVKGEPAERFAISTNYRSGQKILDAANLIGAKLRESDAQSIELVSTEENRDQGVVTVGWFETWPEEIAWLITKIRQQIAQGVSLNEIVILVRRRREIGDLLVALTDAGIPAVVSGASELVDLPEIAELIAILSVIDDPSDNASLVRLLGSTRWGFSLRDMALLGRRASELAGHKRVRGEHASLADEIEEAVADRDPSDLICLSDAVADPGDLPYGDGVTAKCQALTLELNQLRKRANDSLPVLLTAVMQLTGYDVELLADPDSYALRKHDNLMAFRDLVETFTAFEGESSLRGLLAWLSAADEWSEPARITLPVLSDAVNIMTIHSAKGLEREVVLVPALTKRVFPSERSRSRWTSNPGEIPHSLRGDAAHVAADPDWRQGVQNKDLEAFADAIKEQVLLEERRLAYVAVTRAKKALFASGHIWRADVKKPREPSEFLSELAAAAGSPEDAAPDGLTGGIDCWAVQPLPDAENPLAASKQSRVWPVTMNAEKMQFLQQAAAMVNSAVSEVDSSSMTQLAHEMVTAALADSSQARVVKLPAALSVSEVAALGKDPEAFAANLFRPMPTAPSAAGRRGTQFHAWIEEHYQTAALVEPLDLPGGADIPIASEAELDVFKRAFLDSRWANLTPVVLEWDFVVNIAERAIAGRADAVFLIDGKYTIVDWKTGSFEFVDPVQLSLYRHAWAKAHGISAEHVDALFVFWPSAKEFRPERLLGVNEISHLLLGDDT